MSEMWQKKFPLRVFGFPLLWTKSGNGTIIISFLQTTGEARQHVFGEAVGQYQHSPLGLFYLTREDNLTPGPVYRQICDDLGYKGNYYNIYR